MPLAQALHRASRQRAEWRATVRLLEDTLRTRPSPTSTDVSSHAAAASMRSTVNDGPDPRSSTRRRTDTNARAAPVPIGHQARGLDVAQHGHPGEGRWQR